MSAERPRRTPVAMALGLGALALALYLPGLGVEVLRHPLEAKYALAAREMVRGGPWLVAHLFGEVYPDKPPLYFWATAALGWAGGGRISEVTARLPAVVGALAGILLVFRLGADLFGPRAGWLAGAILATSPLFFWYARQGHPDQFLTAFVTLACLALWEGFAARDARHRLGCVAVAYVAMAAAVLSKGLLGLLLPLFAATAYLAATGPLRALPGRLGLWPGLLVFLAVVLGWYGPAVAQNGRGYLYETLVHQHVVRYAHSWVHTGPWYYFLGEFVSGLFPWSLVLPGAMVLGWRGRAGRGEPAPCGPPPDGPARAPFLFPLGWFVTGFLFFSFSSSKRGAYLLPLYPSAALIVGWLWDWVLETRARTPWLGVPLALASGAAAVLAVVLAFRPRHLALGKMVDTLMPGEPWLKVAAAALLLVAAATVWVPWRRGRPGLTLAVLIATQAVVLLTVATIRAPQYEARFPARALAARVAAALPPDQRLLSLLDDYNFIVAFYLDRPLAPLPGPAALLEARGVDGPRYALVDGQDREVLQAAGVTPLVDGQLGPKRIVLIRLDPAPR